MRSGTLSPPDNGGKRTRRSSEPFPGSRRRPGRREKVAGTLERLWEPKIATLVNVHEHGRTLPLVAVGDNRIGKHSLNVATRDADVGQFTLVQAVQLTKTFHCTYARPEASEPSQRPDTLLSPFALPQRFRRASFDPLNKPLAVKKKALCCDAAIRIPHRSLRLR